MSELKNKRILVTGGAGFVGSHLCRKYLNEGCKVICLDNLQKSRTTDNIKEFIGNKNFKFIKHDIIDPIKFNEKIDWIMNFACPVSCVDLQVDPIHTMKSNIHGVINMLDVARENNAKFVQASSSDVYGVRIKGEAMQEDMLGNVDTLTTRACYEEGKRSAETICMDYHRKYGVEVKIVRIFNTYGPNVYHRDGRVMSNFIVAALGNKNLTIYGDGSFTRSHMHVLDLVEGVDRLMKTDKEYTGPVNMGSTKEITVKELAETIIKVTGSSSKIIYDRELTGDPKFRRPNIEKAKRDLGWEPKISLEDGLKDTIDYYKNIDLPDKKILIFATTYYPDMGPAENAIMELIRSMPDTEFHIITTRSKFGLSDFEQIENNFIYRIGRGNILGKYLFPFRGAKKALELSKNFKYRFAWSVMASYGGLAAVIFKIINKKINFLLTFDKTEIKKSKFIKNKLLFPIYRLIFKSADSVFLTDYEAMKKVKNLLTPGIGTSIISRNDQELANKISSTYSSLLDKQEGKLSRPL